MLPSPLIRLSTLTHRRLGAIAPWLTAALLLLPLAFGVGAATSASRATSVSRRLAVTGFQEESASPMAIDRSARALTTVGVDGVDLTHSGDEVGVPDRMALAQLQRSHADYLRAELLVGNWDDSINDFSEPVAHRMLSRSAAIAAVTRTLTRAVARERWDGVSVDLESLHRRDQPGLVKFVRALRAALPANKTLSICITSFTNAREYPANGYDLRELGAATSRVILMTYDQHGPWERTPGPVGALAWQKAGLKLVLRSVPAGKLDLGQAGYGYIWRPHARYTLSDAEARELVARNHARARWVTAVGEWTATLPDRSTLWWADARSYKIRATLAAARHLHGLAVWSLGLSDPLPPQATP